MNQPLIINFEPLPPGAIPTKDGITRLPKMYQGAPYDQTLKVKSKETGEYRDFSGYDEILLQCVTQQGQPVFLSLSKTGGTIIGGSDHLRLRFPGMTTSHVSVPKVNPNAINELRFLHTIILIKDGVEVERFAQGHGYLVAAISKVA